MGESNDQFNVLHQLTQRIQRNLDQIQLLYQIPLLMEPNKN